MVNLKTDLINKIRVDKYFAEIELQRLAQDPNENYENKVLLMKNKLSEISLINSNLGLIEQYFIDTPAAQQPVANAPQGQAHQGQSHGE